MLLTDFNEKDFIKTVLGKYANTANENQFDDCVIVDLAKYTNDNNAPYLVYSIDHPSFIKRNEMNEKENLRFYGRWAAACTCGDVLAMGAEVKGFSLDLAAPLNTDSDDIEKIMEGISQTLNAYNAEFEGGNFDSNQFETVCMAWGIVQRDKIIRRKGAKPGDYILVTGDVGLGWSGQIVDKLNLNSKIDEELLSDISHYKTYPLAPYEAMKRSFETRAITSGMDLSDGLVEFFYNIKNKNNYGVEIEYNNLPVFRQTKEIAKQLDISPQLFAFEPGYDTPITHGWTIDSKYINDVKNIFLEADIPFNIYGKVTENSDINLNFGNNKIKIPQFWDDQFKKEKTLDRWLSFVKQLS